LGWERSEGGAGRLAPPGRHRQHRSADVVHEPDVTPKTIEQVTAAGKHVEVLPDPEDVEQTVQGAGTSTPDGCARSL
jgi:hypothetical protein